LNSKSKVLITGVSGFIGFHLSLLLIKNKFEVIGVDNLNDYYDLQLKKSRLEILRKINVKFFKIDITDFKNLKACFTNEKPDIVVNLAAQAGVRYSLENPESYIQSNIVGFSNILEICKDINVNKLVFASSSSVYGNLDKDKFSEDDKVDKPLNLYATSKKSNELMAYAYANLYNIPCVGLRFFTVYGPWGRPDMAYFKFTKNIIENVAIDVYGNGNMHRDFTYIDDIVDGIFKLLKTSNEKIFSSKNINYELFNIGNDNSVDLNYFISIIEKSVGKQAKKNFLGVQPGDVKRTSANIIKIQSKVNFLPQTKIEDGIPKFVKWYKDYYVSK
jgi:UDP-glucuronate 4-epimerase